MRNPIRLIALLAGMTLGTAVAGTLEKQPRIVDDVYHALTTVRDMYSIGVALEAYSIDHHRYPAVSSIAELKPLLEGRYVPSLPEVDAWGVPIKYVPGPDGRSYRLVSAGSDKTFDESTWGTRGVFLDSREDAVFEGHFVRKWAIDIP